jgi:hypothetical protein
MRLNAIRTSMMLVTILLLPLLVLVAQETSALLVEGQQGQARVIQVQGKNYVEVEGLARITGESLRFAGNQIILTSPSGGNTAPQTEQSAPVPRPAAGLSRPFLSARIETMREILEWCGIENWHRAGVSVVGCMVRQLQEANSIKPEAGGSSGQHRHGPTGPSTADQRVQYDGRVCAWTMPPDTSTACLVLASRRSTRYCFLSLISVQSPCNRVF